MADFSPLAISLCGWSKEGQLSQTDRATRTSVEILSTAAQLC